MTIRARFDGKSLVPLDPVDLPTDRVLEIDVRATDESPPGSPAAILRALDGLPPIPSDILEEFERSLEEAEAPPPPDSGIFDDLTDEAERR